jgi:thiol-disulfide isomerase/thioredoxin
MFLKTFYAVTFTIAMLAAASAHAAPIEPFDAAAFKVAQDQGRAILVDVHADWCPICHLQGPTLEKLSKDPAFSNLLILRVNFDKQIAEKRALNVRSQSTLIAYHGNEETGRSVGVTSAPAITALAKTAFKTGN